MATSDPSKTPGSDVQRWLNDEAAKIQPALSVPGYWEAVTSNCASWVGEVASSFFWREAVAQFSSWSSGYKSRHGGLLVRQGSLPPFVSKGVDRICSKTHAAAKRDGTETVWNANRLIPSVNDLIRTRVACSYLDGVEYLADCLSALAEKLGVRYQRNRQGRLEGYFAQHFYFDHDMLFRWAGRAELVSVTCEVQIATELSTQVWDTNHVHYERWRGNAETPDDWQWKPDDPRFIARQLGHMVHLADGLLVQLRNAGASKDSK